MIDSRIVRPQIVTAMLFALLLAGCGGPPPLARPAATTQGEQVTVQTAAATVPPPVVDTTALVTVTGGPAPESGLLADCVELSAPLQETVQVAVTTTEAPLEDPVTGASLPGCRLSASWTGDHLGDLAAVSLQLSALLIERGWQADERYLADAPTGTAAGFTHDGKLALLRVEWKPAPEVDCPADQPITACELQPEQRLFGLTLNIASMVP